MKSLFMPATQGNFATPKINFDLDAKIFSIDGESFLEDTDAFYAPIIDWLTSFVEAYSGKVVFNFSFLYYNSSSSKTILRIFKLLKCYQEAQNEVVINWHYLEGNEDIEQEGQDFADLVDISINLKVLK